MRALPLGPSEKLRMGSGHGQRGSAWGQGHDPREGCAEIGRRWALGGAPCGARATILVRGVPKCALGTHAGPATGTFGKAPYGVWATILVRRWRSLLLCYHNKRRPPSSPFPPAPSLQLPPWFCVFRPLRRPRSWHEQNPPKGVGS